MELLLQGPIKGAGESCSRDPMSQAGTFLEHHDGEVPLLFFAQLPGKEKNTIIYDKAELFLGMSSTLR